MNKLEKLFKEKLTDHSVAPSARAWEKIEAGLSKKNKGVIWLRWAAIFLLGALMLGLFLIRKEDIPLPMAEKKEIPEKIRPEIEKPAIAIVEDKAPSKNKGSQKKAKKSGPVKQIAPQVLIAKEDQKEVAEVAKETTEEPVTDQVETSLTEAPIAQSSKKTQSILLIYTLETIEPTQESENTEIASVDKKETSIKRVMRFAKDVKNGDAPLGGLRVMKEDLFALELKKKPTGKKQ